VEDVRHPSLLVVHRTKVAAAFHRVAHPVDQEDHRTDHDLAAAAVVAVVAAVVENHHPLADPLSYLVALVRQVVVHDHS
jgi:hypothetical protein